MRAKFILEKFTQDSDPIADMNIGMMHQIKLWMKSIDEPFKNKDDALVYSARDGKLDFVEYLLAAGADVHASYDFALRWASDKGHTEIVKFLLAAGADVHVMDDAALRWASGNGHTEVVKVLLAAGANVHAENDRALRRASYKGHTEVVKILKDHIAKEKRKKVKESINEKFTQDSDPIADMNIGMMHEIKLWMKSIGKLFQDKDNALIYSAKDGKLDFVEYLLAAGANLHVKNDGALQWASEKGYIKIVKVLLAAGADVHAKDDYSLRWASGNGHTEVVKILLAAGADVHANNDHALQWASYNGHIETVKVLLTAGADVHVDNDGALQWASINRHTEVVKVLKDHIAKEKKVKESLNEKFTEDDSDPIHDMGIGIITFENIKPGDIMVCKKDSKYFIFRDKTTFPIYGLYIVHKVKKHSSKNLLELEVIPYGYKYYLDTEPISGIMSIRNQILNNEKLSVANFHINIAPISRWKKYFNIIQPRELK